MNATSMLASRGWLVLAAAAAAVTIGTQMAGLREPAFVAKPLATIAIFAWALGRAGDLGSRRRFVLLGLVLSLAGDVALLWPREGFITGLVAFLLAHLAYIVAFTRGSAFAARRAPLAAYAAIAGVVLALLWPHIGAGLRVPVLAYVACLAAMAAQAAVWAIVSRGTPLAPYARRAAIGGALFMTSDALLAIDKFAQPLPAAPLLILATYWTAQALIAASLVPRGAGARAALTSP